MKRGSSIVNSIDNHSSAICTFGRDYVYSLHQNVKSSLLYGKNNVTVALPPDGPPLKGYLSLHQNSPGNVTVKWTPNQLMHSRLVSFVENLWYALFLRTNGRKNEIFSICFMSRERIARWNFKAVSSMRLVMEVHSLPIYFSFQPPEFTYI